MTPEDGPDGSRFSVDELRALAVVSPLTLPRFVTREASDPKVDAAALRGLAARGLVLLDPDPDVVRLAPELTRMLAPCESPHLMIEAEWEVADVVASHAIVASREGESVVFSELPGGLVTASASDTIPDPTVLWGLDQVTRAGEVRFTVPTGDYLDADDQVLAGSPGKAVEVLANAGASTAAARAWVDAVSRRSRTVAVTIARNLGDGRSGPYAGGEWCWLVGADGTGWRVVTEPDAPAAGASREPSDASATVTSVSQVDRAAIREALQAALAPVESLAQGTARAQQAHARAEAAAR
ncbi:MAG: hypothetical protein ACRDT1_15190 [Micromonosporaceae bacterium]